MECTHNYNRSYYYAGNDKTKRLWEGYDAIAQTADACRYVNSRAGTGKPFMLFLSWGPPHDPYRTAPEKYRAMFEPEKIVLRPNVPEEEQKQAAKHLSGYYAHIAALDDCIGRILKSLDETGIAGDTILVFTSDHGDMLKSHGHRQKQRPWDESIRVPFLLRYPRAHGSSGRKVKMPLNTLDIMPTLLGLSGLTIPGTAEGTDYSSIVGKAPEPPGVAALITCPSPFADWKRPVGREWRGVRTARYTYIRDLKGPWLLYDNEKDPYQLENLVGKPEHARLQGKMDAVLQEQLDKRKDRFLPGPEYIRQWGWKVDETGSAPYTH
jgi:arylsulfatase A-like enzyme